MKILDFKDYILDKILYKKFTIYLKKFYIMEQGHILRDETDGILKSF